MSFNPSCPKVRQTTRSMWLLLTDRNECRLGAPSGELVHGFRQDVGRSNLRGSR